jgi:hypothetical protein
VVPETAVEVVTQYKLKFSEIADCVCCCLQTIMVLFKKTPLESCMLQFCYIVMSVIRLAFIPEVDIDTRYLLPVIIMNFLSGWR